MVYLGRNRRIRVSKKEAKAQKKRDISKLQEIEEIQKQPKEIKLEGKFVIPKIVTVRKFAEILNLPVTVVIEKLMSNGIMASINESIDFDTASIIADDLGAEISEEKKQEEEALKHSNLKSRPGIVVVLGHVDHGKTSILDAIRKSDVASGESGGITQHIGAYQVRWKDKEGKITPITFLDTPGHEAFSTMRAHGANITDIAILVVAADDGVKPQTKEAISHIKSANIPVIVAINKIDKPEANPDRVKKELGDLGLVSEEWGGNTPMVLVSAKKNIGISELLDNLVLAIEINDFKSQYDGQAEGVVIESHMQSGVGPVATVLLKHGTLKKGDYLVIGTKTICHIRFIENYIGERINKATPAMPIRIAGLSQVPNFGERVIEVSNEREAKNKVNASIAKNKLFSMYEASQAIKSGKITDLNIILKADTQGSLEAIKNTIVQLSTDKVKVKVISDGIGTISDNDIALATGQNTLVIGFKVKIDENIKHLAKEKNISLKNYDIIYRLIEDIQAIISGLVEPELHEVLIGKAEIIKAFHKTADRKLVGAKIIDGKFVLNEKVRILHSGEDIGSGKIISLQIEQEKQNEVTKGHECGIGINTGVILKIGDIIEEFKMEKVV